MSTTEQRQKPVAAPEATNPERLRAARMASGIGGLALVFAVLAGLAQGDVTPLVLGSALIGIIGIGLWTVLAPDDFRALIGGRRAVHGTNSVLVTILLAGIVVIVYTLSSGSGVAADLTSVGYYQLKPNIRPVVENLTRPIQITAFYSRQRLGQQSAEAPLLKMFVDAAPDKVRLVYADPDEQPLLARDFGLRSAFGIFVSFLTAEGNPDLRFTTQMRTDVDFVNERWVAEAILQLQARGQFRVLFTTGSGELSTETDATGIRDGMAAVGIRVGTVDLQNADLPDDLTALVILAPRRDFTQAEVDKIAAFTARGGKLLLMAEPAYESSIRFMQSPESPMATYLWQTWGVRPQRNIVVDPLSYNDNIFYVRPADFLSNHPIVNKDTIGTPARPMFALAQSWEIAERLPADVTVEPLYRTSNEGFGRLDLRDVAQNPDQVRRGALDLAGPLILTAAAENARTGARLVVVGDADWITNDLIVAFDGQALWTNMIDWLTQFLERVTVNPVSVPLPINVSSGALNLVALITLLILPGLVLLMGTVVWWRRSRR